MASIVETYDINTVYQKARWCRNTLNTCIHISDFPRKCECLTTNKNKCNNSVLYACYSSDLSKTEKSVIYVCGIHKKCIDAEFCVIYKRVSKHNNALLSTYFLIQQVHSPDTYMEYCTTFYYAYTKVLDEMRKFLDFRDDRAIAVGDLDGSYPIEMARLERIMRVRRSDVGFNLYNGYEHIYHEIKKLHSSYESVILKYHTLYNTMNDYDEIKYFNENNVLSLKYKYEDVCSICLDNVTENTGGQLKECKHTFHNACLMKWLTTKLDDSSSCPCCRKPICKLLLYKL